VISELFPILSTPDLERALGFYRDLLGGTVSYSFTGDDGEPVYVGVNVGSSHLGIGLRPAAGDAGGLRSISLWVYADDCDHLVHRVRTAGGTVTEEPSDQPWGSASPACSIRTATRSSSARSSARNAGSRDPATRQCQAGSSTAIWSPTEIVPSVRMSALMPPRWTRSLMIPGRVLLSRMRQGSQISTP
jgi:lactoylglutathione lyase